MAAVLCGQEASTDLVPGVPTLGIPISRSPREVRASSLLLSSSPEIETQRTPEVMGPRIGKSRQSKGEALQRVRLQS